MPEIVVAGGGFAAVWTAAAAARRRFEAGLAPGDMPITLVAPDEDMVIRPRLYEQHLDDLQVPLRRGLEPARPSGGGAPARRRHARRSLEA